MNALRRVLFSAAVGAVLQVLGAAEVRVIRGAFTETVEAVPAAPELDPAGPQVLEFAGGERLHGTLEALDMAQGQLNWWRNDAAEPLRVPLGQVSRWRSAAPLKKSALPMATIKFVGSDWLTARVRAIQGDKIHLQLGDGASLTTDRAHVEWIYFSKNGAAECYDGPTSLAGWTSAGGWGYREGALRATAPSPLGRLFAVLPDLVEYRLSVDQGEAGSGFTLTLHSQDAAVHRATRGVVQVMMRADSLNLWACVGGNFKSVQADLAPLWAQLGGRPKGPLHFRVYEDFPAGRIMVSINGRKAAEWKIDKGEAGRNGGAFQFQSTSWSGDKEQSLTNIQVVPWDGREPGQEDELAADEVVLVGGGVKTGRVTGWDGRSLKLGASRVAANQFRLLRFRRPANPSEDEAPVAQVRLAGRGEFDAVALGWQDGRFLVRTNFGGELSLAPAQLTEVQFQVVEAKPAPASDLLVFGNGDRLRGSLEAAEHAGTLRWRMEPLGPPVEFSSVGIAGIQFAPRPPGPPGNVVARFRNGDWLGGMFVTLDREQLILENAEGEQQRMARAMVQAIYFGNEGAPAVSDGAADHEIWERGFDLNTGTSVARQLPAGLGSPWTYAAGAFSLARATGADPTFQRGGNLQLGRMFEALAPRAEMSFTIATENAPAYCNAQLFTESGKAGYMLNLGGDGLALYDMDPARRARGVAPQQFPFPKEIQRQARVRHLRLLADRTSGRLVAFVDGVLAAQFTPKAGSGPRRLGRGMVILPPANQGCTLSNLWVGPWSGQALTAGAAPAPEIITLVNGDEVPGTVALATPAGARLESELGPLEVPLERLAVVDLGGSPSGRAAGTRLQLAGQGALTVSAWRIENNTVHCRSELTGELKVPLASVQEIIFAPPPPVSAAR